MLNSEEAISHPSIKLEPISKLREESDLCICSFNLARRYHDRIYVQYSMLEALELYL